MKKSLTTTILAAFCIVCAGSISAQNYSQGFENEKDWKIQPKFETMVSISSEQAATGENSLKFDIKDFGDNKVVSAFTNKKKPVTLPAGEYTVKAKVYLGKSAPMGFSIILKGDDDNRQMVNLKTKAVAKGRWVEVEADASLAAVDNGVMTVNIKQNAKAGGVGLLYVDDIEIIKR